MSEAMVITPVRDGKVDELQQCLRSLSGDVDVDGGAAGGASAARRSAFQGVLPPTHFARLVVIELDGTDQLMFSARFDGPVDDYLRALAATDQARRIWGFCELDGARGQTGPLTRERLQRHLCDPRHQLAAQYVVAALPGAVTVAEVNAALRLREQLADFAARAATLDQWALAHDFRQLPAIQRLLGR